MAAKPLRGYQRLPGSARRYRTPSGDVISRRQYDNLRAQQAGWKNQAEMRRFRQSTDWHAWRFKIRANDKTQDTGYSGDLMINAYRVQQMRDAGYDDTSPELSDPDGPLAAILVAVGYRDENWDWAVGDTPSGVRA
jgi:hypothetical protein